MTSEFPTPESLAGGAPAEQGARSMADRLMPMFLANMNHELRTPLNAILGFSEMIRDAELGTIDPRYRDYAGDINASGQSLLNLITDIFDLALIDAGLLDLAVEQINVIRMIDECRRLMLDQATASGIEIVTEVPVDLLPARVDPIRFPQILLNLLSNAVKFTPAGGKVTIAAAVRPGEIELSVADTGIGMAQGEIQVALALFRQVDGSWSRRYQGLGIGLPLAKRLLELHGGELQIASKPGSGTTVTILLPRR